jgi:hypothetical protein
MSDLVLGLDKAAAARFGEDNLPLKHRLHESPLFSDARLMQLIEQTPRDRYHVNTPGDGEGRASWREGSIDNLSGEKVFEAIARGALWVHLQRVGETDKAYADLLDAIFAEFEAKVPGLATYRRTMSILISSPKLQVAYHCDVPGQMLWQIRGRKTLYIYPNRAPFLPQEALENIILRRASDTELAFDPSFDAYAEIYDLAPGDMLHWPLNGPHRVVNQDCLNISVTTEHWTNDLRAQYAANYANGLLRRSLGLSRLSRETRGLGFGAKMLLAGAHKYAATRGRRSLVFKVDFRVDPDAPAGVRDVPVVELQR